MVIGLLTLKIHFPEAGSLKGKRHILRSLMDRLKNRFNVSIAEVGDRDLWQSSILGVAHVNTDRREADSTLTTLLNLLDEENDLQVVDVSTEFL